MKIIPTGRQRRSRLPYELEQTGRVLIRTIQKAMGLPEGEANLLARELNRKHGNQAKQAELAQQERSARERERRDDYLYHVTTQRRWQMIKRTGLMPGAEATFQNYKHSSSGKIFLTERGGVSFWKSRIADHLEHNGDRSKLVVLRIPKAALKDKLQPDRAGSQDSHIEAYFVTEPIPPFSIELVRE